MSVPVFTLIGGPTALIEAGGFRLLTDPTPLSVSATGGQFITHTHFTVRFGLNYQFH
jgi:hypothetical protein